MEYFLTGAGAMTSGVRCVTAAQETLWVGQQFTAFAAVEATSDNMAVKFINTLGIVVYNYTMGRRLISRNSSSYERPKQAVVEYNKLAFGAATRTRQYLFWMLVVLTILMSVRYFCRDHSSGTGSMVDSIVHSISSCDCFEGAAGSSSPLYRRRLMRRVV